jgi:hypothetical protein
MENQKFFTLTRVERVIAKWSILADTIEEAVALWNGDGLRTSDYVHYESEEVTDVYEATWRDPGPTASSTRRRISALSAALCA